MSKVASKLRNWFGLDIEETEDEFYDEDREPEQDLEPFEPREEKRRERGGRGKVVDLPVQQSNHNKLIVYRPVSYDDNMIIIENLRSRKPIILNMESIEVPVAQRILDFMTGACMAMGGDIRKISAKIFAVVPADYEIVGNSDGFKE